MNQTNLSLTSRQVAVAISWVLLGLTPVQAQPTQSIMGEQPPNSNPLENFIFVNPPPDQDAPEGTEASGDRNPCPAIPKTLTALVLVRTTQQDDQKLESREVKTTQDYPTFWFYIPYQAENIVYSNFLIQDRQGKTIYETPDDFRITSTPGVIRISLPATKPPLNRNQWYQWRLNIEVNCAPNLPPQRDSIQGWVKREEVNTEFQTQLRDATPRQRGILYAKNGFLSDALTTLAEIKDNDLIQNDWSQLLLSVGLDEIATEPIVDCCIVENH